MSEKVISEREAVMRERAAIREATEWIFSAARSMRGIEHVDARTLPEVLRPLPKVKRPRVVPDPMKPSRAFRVVGEDVQYRDRENFDPSRWNTFGVSPSRVRVWADLLECPTEEVDDDGASTVDAV